MSDALFFIPILEQALRQEDTTSALRNAFGRIQTLGQEPRYQRGYRQFARFMQEAGTADPREAAERLLDQFCRDFERPDALDIVVERDDKPIARRSFHAAPGKQVIGGIKTGSYLVGLDTGRVLWEGLLTEEDLIWAKAFPGRPLKMAADTGEDRGQPTRQIPLLQGSVVLRVFPGIECGTLEIELTQP
ncbi:MAG TPA: hypothetical protein VNA25_21350 [Phycisphaerae bacterium]|nr:hypothetical protein [Phycisphaerae bacterium]